MDISRLWSNLKLGLPSYSSFHSRLEQPVRLCLLRSKSRPLSVNLGSYVSDDTGPLVRPLVEESARWQHAQIGGLLEAKFPSLISGKSFPLLETLEVRHYRAGDGLPDLFLFNSAPQLHSLKNYQAPSPDKLRAFTPRNQISNFEMICGPSIYNGELYNFPSLKSMVYAEVDHSFVPEPDEILWQTLPHLSMVEFQMSNYEAGYDILEAFAQTPNRQTHSSISDQLGYQKFLRRGGRVGYRRGTNVQTQLAIPDICRFFPALVVLIIGSSH
ncbi:hypothetical protein D9758_016637 [Tetrapyrgos nigripes]|uniref:Uncharacterized protein n=1 Tax=Tetrapyrgos nigripes TaxID=182062 RepID=A0A8H5C093_9AGAR|nr:hypothetical protein D9758_016637 [Tetrapyrgos nigripes]